MKMSFLFTGGNRNKQMSILVWRLKIVYPVKKYYYSRKYTHEKMKDVFFNWYWYNTISYFFSTCCCLFCVLTKQLAVLLNPLYPHRRQHRKATKKKITITHFNIRQLNTIHCIVLHSLSSFVFFRNYLTFILAPKSKSESSDVFMS